MCSQISSYICCKFIIITHAGGLYKAILDASELGAKAFGMFLKSQRQWKAKPLEDRDADKFKTTLQV